MQNPIDSQPNQEKPSSKHQQYPALNSITLTQSVDLPQKTFTNLKTTLSSKRLHKIYPANPLHVCETVHVVKIQERKERKTARQYFGIPLNYSWKRNNWLSVINKLCEEFEVWVNFCSERRAPESSLEVKILE